MIDTLENAGGNTQTRRWSAWDASPKGAADVSKQSGTQDDAADAYRAEFMPVGDPRPQYK